MLQDIIRVGDGAETSPTYAFHDQSGLIDVRRYKFTGRHGNLHQTLDCNNRFRRHKQAPPLGYSDALHCVYQSDLSNPWSNGLISFSTCSSCHIDLICLHARLGHFFATIKTRASGPTWRHANLMNDNEGVIQNNYKRKTSKRIRTLACVWSCHCSNER